jgi:hypothetical protein
MRSGLGMTAIPTRSPRRSVKSKLRPLSLSAAEQEGSLPECLRPNGVFFAVSVRLALSAK